MSSRAKFDEGTETSFGELEVGQVFRLVETGPVLAIKVEARENKLSDLVMADTLNDMIASDPTISPNDPTKMNASILAPNWWFDFFAVDTRVFPLEPTDAHTEVWFERVKAQAEAESSFLAAAQAKDEAALAKRVAKIKKSRLAHFARRDRRAAAKAKGDVPDYWH